MVLWPPSSPAKRTSAQAVPSGKGRTPCSFTIRAFRKGIIKRTPRTPPKSEIIAMFQKEGAATSVDSAAHIKSAGIVKIAPAAKDSPADPIV